MDVLVISPTSDWTTHCTQQLSAFQVFRRKNDWKRNVYPQRVQGSALPHGVEQSPVIFQPQQLVRCGHIVRDGLLPIEEEGVRGPDVTGQEVVQGKHLHRAFKAETLVFPALTEEYVNCVFLQKKMTQFTRDNKKREMSWRVKDYSIL